MLAITLVMHQPLGAAFSACAQHVLGAVPRLTVFDIPADADVAEMADTVYQHLAKTRNQGGLVLSDLYGATPFNIAYRAVTRAQADEQRVCLLAGVNLAMILKALTDLTPDPFLLRDNLCRGAMRNIVAE